MKKFSFTYNENFKYILIIAIILIITNLYDDYFIAGKNFNNDTFNFLLNIFNYIGQFLTIFIYYKYKEKNTDKKKLISSDKTSLNYLINSNNNNNFVNLNFSFWIFNLILFYIALIDFCHMLYKMGIFSIKSKEKISTLKYYNYYSLEPLSLFILYHKFFIKKQI